MAGICNFSVLKSETKPKLILFSRCSIIYFETGEVGQNVQLGNCLLRPGDNPYAATGPPQLENIDQAEYPQAKTYILPLSDQGNGSALREQPVGVIQSHYEIRCILNIFQQGAVCHPYQTMWIYQPLVSLQ